MAKILNFKGLKNEESRLDNLDLSSPIGQIAQKFKDGELDTRYQVALILAALDISLVLEADLKAKKTMIIHKRDIIRRQISQELLTVVKTHLDTASDLIVAEETEVENPE